MAGMIGFGQRLAVRRTFVVLCAVLASMWMTRPVAGFANTSIGKQGQRCKICLWGCRRNHRCHNESKKNENLRISSLVSLNDGDGKDFWTRIHDLVDSAKQVHHFDQLNRRKRKGVKLLYTLGFFMTFPLGPIIFLAIRHRDNIFHDLRLSSRSNSSARHDRTRNDYNKNIDPQTLHESRQVDQALQESMAVLKELRDTIDFDFRLLQQIDQQAQEFLDKTKQALASSSSSSSDDDDDDVTARRYLSKRQALMDKGTKMNEKIKVAQKQLRILEDNVWSLQTRSMELNARIRGEQ